MRKYKVHTSVEKDQFRNLIRFGLVFYLIFPFIFLFVQFPMKTWPNFPELYWAFKNSFIQSFFSTLGSLIVGIWIGMGLLVFPKYRNQFMRNLLEAFCLLPNFLPPIFTLLVALNIMDPFPMGIFGVVFVHIIMNFGLVAVMVAEVLEYKTGSIIELAYIEGASKWYFLVHGLWPIVKKDLFLIGLFVFVVSFQSFSVPLIVGGGRGTTLEVLIYEKIKLLSDWGSAVTLATLQTVFIFIISLIVRRKRISHTYFVANLDFIKSRWSVLGLVLFICIYIFGYFEALASGFKSLSTLYEAQSTIFWGFMGSLFIGLGVGCLTYLILMLIAYCWPKFWFERFLSGFVAPSTALVSFMFLVLGANGGFWSFAKIIFGLVLLYSTSLFRLGWQSGLEKLEGQMDVALAMGASQEQIFFEIVLPQISDKAGVLSGLAAIWACGDFAVSRILAYKDLSIALMVETLMSSYRLNQAAVLSLLIILSGSICYYLCVKGSHVISRKFSPSKR